MTVNANDQILQAIQDLQEQMAHGFSQIEEHFEEVEKRFDLIDRRLDDLEERFQKMQDGIDLLAKKQFDNETDIYRLKKDIGHY